MAFRPLNRLIKDTAYLKQDQLTRNLQEFAIVYSNNRGNLLDSINKLNTYQTVASAASMATNQPFTYIELNDTGAALTISIEEVAATYIVAVEQGATGGTITSLTASGLTLYGEDISSYTWGSGQHELDLIVITKIGSVGIVDIISYSPLA